MKNLLLSTAVLVALFTPSGQATANMIRTFEAAAIEAGDYPSLTVWPGAGLTINLTEINESVKQIWLDDPSKVTLDYAGELCANPCQGGVQVVHLKRINNVHFPNLPATPQTTLTVVTVSPQGERVYKFFITYGTGHPSYLSVNLSPTSPVGERLNPVASSLPQHCSVKTSYWLGRAEGAEGAEGAGGDKKEIFPERIGFSPSASTASPAALHQPILLTEQYCLAI